MGLELEVSEFSVIRPIRTAVSSVGSATPTRVGSEEGKDAADTGCVTPTAVSPSPLQGGVDADAGCVTPKAAVSPSSRQGVFDGDDAVCVTPTALSPSPRQGGDVDADDTGCVTPRAMSSVPLLLGDVVDDTDGCITPASAMNPTLRRGAFVVLDIDCVTPTSATSVLRPSMECPPAPRKPARSPPVNKRKLCDGRAALRRCFFPVPRDLTKVFVPRGPADNSPPQAAAKKIRVHPVG
ncbi:hypothetical protein EJB05_41814, partial [Eragrostis curvula]